MYVHRDSLSTVSDERQHQEKTKHLLMLVYYKGALMGLAKLNILKEFSRDKMLKPLLNLLLDPIRLNTTMFSLNSTIPASYPNIDQLVTRLPSPSTFCDPTY